MARERSPTRSRTDNGGRSLAVYRRYREAVINDPSQIRCVICGGWVDKSLPYRDPLTGKVNMTSASLEHTKPLALGGGLLSSGMLSHLGCNMKNGTGVKAEAARLAKELKDPARHF